MRTIRFTPTDCTEPTARDFWDKWQKRADAATDAALRRWEAWCQQGPDPVTGQRQPFEAGLQQAVWSDLKKWLNDNLYHFRCAYCEWPLETDRYEGDAEHYRPKGRVTWRDPAGAVHIARCRLPDGTDVDHPGYFWLAYDWRNLVPVCSACNSGLGKVDQFPVGKTHVLHVDEAAAGFVAGQIPAREHALEAWKSPRSYFLPPARLDALETPLLLTPLNPTPEREPGKHLRYGIGGLVVALDGSELGSKSIEVYQLKRDKLRIRRQEAQEVLQMKYHSAMQRAGHVAIQDAQAVLARYRSGEPEHATAALDALEELEAMARQLRANR